MGKDGIAKRYRKIRERAFTLGHSKKRSFRGVIITVQPSRHGTPYRLGYGASDFFLTFTDLPFEHYRKLFKGAIIVRFK